MKRYPCLLTALVILLSCSTTTHARYITEHQQLHEIIGTHELPGFNGDYWPVTASLPPIVFDEPLDLSDVDRLTITIIGTISPIAVCGDGNPRPDECYTVNTGVEHDWTPYNSLPSLVYGGVDDHNGIFSDSDPAFHAQWFYESLQLPSLHWPDGTVYPGRTVDPIESIQITFGALTDDLMEIPLNFICLAYGYCHKNYGLGLEVASPIELTITDAYITREWNIPEPASFAILTTAGLAFIRRH